MRKIAVLLMITALSSSLGGCYLGRTPGRKAVAYIANGTFVVVGVGGIAHAQQQHDDAQIASMISAVPLIVGLVGIVLNIAVPTEKPAPAPETKPLPVAATVPETRSAAPRQAKEAARQEAGHIDDVDGLDVRRSMMLARTPTLARRIVKVATVLDRVCSARDSFVVLPTDQRPAREEGQALVEAVSSDSRGRIRSSL